MAAHDAEGRLLPRRLRLAFAAVVALFAAPHRGTQAAAIGSNVPVAETAPCPPGYYRRAVLVFACGPQDGEVYFPLAHESKTAVGIPKGIRNLKLTLDASGPINITIVDPATNASVANGTANLQAPAEWNGMSIAFTSGPSRGGTKEGVDFSGTLPSRLDVRLANQLTTQNLATITYSYDGFDGCPDVPVGCARYDQATAREWVYNWSTWVSTEYPKAASAWQALASQAMRVQYGSGARAGPIPFHLWRGVWSKWAGSHAKNLDWQMAFKFIDSLHTEDQLVEVVEFIRAYKLAGIGLSMYNWCTALRSQYPDASTAWLAVSGPTAIAGIDYSRWKSAVWPSFVPLDHFAKASSAGSFQYADGNNNGVVSRKEFDAIYHSCTYRPSTYTNAAVASTTTPTTTTTSPATTSTSTSASTSFTTASASGNASGNASGTALESGKAGLRGSGTTSGGSSSSTTATTTTRSTTTATTTSRCCPEATAECLACQANQSIDVFCGSPLGDDVEGCPGVEVTDAQQDVQPQSPLWRRVPQPVLSSALASNESSDDDADGRKEVSDCPFDGVAYAPRMEQQEESNEASVSACQARCAGVAGCAYFSFRSGKGACNLHGPSAVWSLTTDSGAVAGPARCVARLGLRVSDVDFMALSDSQKRSIAQSFVRDLSNVTWLHHEAVKDLQGRQASVSLSAGSLVVDANLELPPGGRLSNYSEQIGSEAFADRLRSSLAEVGVRAPEVADHPIHHRHAIEAKLEVSHGCLLTGTRYDVPDKGHSQPAAANHTSALSVTACQTACSKDQGCEYFTFERSTNACLFRGGGVVPKHDPWAISGPRQCAGLPVVPRRGWGVSDSHQKQGSIPVWWWILGVGLACLAISGLAAALIPRRGKRKRGGIFRGAKYAPLSHQEQDEEDGEGSSDGSESGEDDEGEDGAVAPALTAASRELRAPGSVEAGNSILGFLGTEALRR